MVIKMLKPKQRHDDSEQDLRQLSLIRSMITANETAKRLGNISEEEYEKVVQDIEGMVKSLEEKWEIT